MWHYCAPKVEAIYLHNRVYIAYNRKGLTTFAVFCLSLFVATKEKPISGIGCRSPPFNLDFSKKFRLEVKRYGLQQSQRRKEMAALEREAEEKQLRKQRMQEAGTYLEGVADDTQQPEIKTVEDFLNSIENQQLYQILVKVDKLTLQIALMKIQGYSTCEIAHSLALRRKLFTGEWTGSKKK